MAASIKKGQGHKTVSQLASKTLTAKCFTRACQANIIAALMQQKMHHSTHMWEATAQININKLHNITYWSYKAMLQKFTEGRDRRAMPPTELAGRIGTAIPGNLVSAMRFKHLGRVVHHALEALLALLQCTGIIAGGWNSLSRTGLSADERAPLSRGVSRGRHGRSMVQHNSGRCQEVE